MNRIIRAIVRLLITLLVIALLLGAAAAVGYRYYLPDIVREQIDAELSARGLTDAGYTLEHVTTTQTRLTDIQLGEGLSIDAITVDYAWQPLLLSRRLETVTLHGLNYTVDVTGGQVDLGPLAPLLKATDDAPAGPLPIDHLRFVDSSLTIRDDQTLRRLPLAAGDVLAYDDDQRAFVIDIAMRAGQPDHLIARLFETFTGYTIGGDVKIAGTISVDGRPPSLTATLRHTTIANQERNQRFAGVTGKIAIDSFSPVGTPNAQMIGWESAKVGQLDIDAGSFQFQLTGQAVHVERLQWRIGSGRFWAHAFAIRPDLIDLKINLFWENVELNDWLAIVAAQKASGSGRLYGRLPVRVRTDPQLTLSFGEGYLITRGPGHVTIEDKQLVEGMVEQYAGQFGIGERNTVNQEVSAMVQDRIVQSLQDFQYQELSFVVEEEEDELVLRVRTHGEGRKVPQELHLDLNFTGIGDLIDVMLRTKVGLGRAKDTMLKQSLGIE